MNTWKLLIHCMMHALHMGFSGEVQNVQTKLKVVCDYSQNVISEHFVFYSKQLVCVASGGTDRVIVLCFPSGKTVLM